MHTKLRFFSGSWQPHTWAAAMLLMWVGMLHPQSVAATTNIGSLPVAKAVSLPIFTQTLSPAGVVAHPLLHLQTLHDKSHSTAFSSFAHVQWPLIAGVLLLLVGLALFWGMYPKLYKKRKQKGIRVFPFAKYFLPDNNKHLNSSIMKFFNISTLSQSISAFVQNVVSTPNLRYAFVALAMLGTFSVSAQTVTKQLYLSNPGQALDRIHPGLVTPIDNTTATSETLGAITCGPAGPYQSPTVPFSTPTDITNQFGGNNALTPDVAVYRSSAGVETVHMVFLGKSASASKNNIYYSSKTGAGSWTTPVAVSSDGFNQDAQEFPSIAVDANNKAYVVYAHKNSVTAPVDAKINIYYVTNVSGSWSSPVRISNDGFNQDADTPEIALDASGKAYVVYVHKDGASDSKLNIYYVTNTSGSWSSPVRVSNDGFNQDVKLNPAIAVDGANKAHVVYVHKNGASDSKINIYYVTNTSGSWSTPARISSDLANQDAQPNPSIVTDAANKPHVVYAHKDGNLGDGHINIYYTNKGGASWSTPVDVSNDKDSHDSLNPDLAISCTGIVRVVFGNDGRLYANL